MRPIDEASEPSAKRQMGCVAELLAVAIVGLKVRGLLNSPEYKTATGVSADGLIRVPISGSLSRPVDRSESLGG